MPYTLDTFKKTYNQNRSDADYIKDLTIAYLNTPVYQAYPYKNSNDCFKILSDELKNSRWIIPSDNMKIKDLYSKKPDTDISGDLLVMLSGPSIFYDRPKECFAKPTIPLFFALPLKEFCETLSSISDSYNPFEHFTKEGSVTLGKVFFNLSKDCGTKHLDEMDETEKEAYNKLLLLHQLLYDFKMKMIPEKSYVSEDLSEKLKNDLRPTVFGIVILNFLNEKITHLFPLKNRSEETYNYLSRLDDDYSWISLDEIGIRPDEDKLVRYLYKHPLKETCPYGLVKELSIIGQFYGNESYKEECRSAFDFANLPLHQFLSFASEKCRKMNPYTRIYREDDKTFELENNRLMNIGDAFKKYADEIDAGNNKAADKLRLLLNCLFQCKKPLLEEELDYLHRNGYDQYIN